jgi:hypothetical protein
MKIDDKIILDKYPLYSGKTKLINVNFLLNFVLRVKTNDVSFRIVFTINFPAKAIEYC